MALAGNDLLFYVTDKTGAMQGFALCRESTGGGTVGEQSQLYPLRCSGVPPLRDDQGNVIDRSSLSRFPGYDTYDGGGKLLYVALIEAFHKKTGIGSLLIKELQSKGYALIEAETNDKSAFKFFTEKCEFQETGLTCEDGEQQVVVWASHLSLPKRPQL